MSHPLDLPATLGYAERDTEMTQSALYNFGEYVEFTADGSWIRGLVTRVWKYTGRSPQTYTLRTEDGRTFVREEKSIRLPKARDKKHND